MFQKTEETEEKRDAGNEKGKGEMFRAILLAMVGGVVISVLYLFRPVLKGGAVLPLLSAGVVIGVSAFLAAEFFGPLKGRRLCLSIAVAGFLGGLAFGLVNGSSVLISASVGAVLLLSVYVVEEIGFRL